MRCSLNRRSARSSATLAVAVAAAVSGCAAASTPSPFSEARGTEAVENQQRSPNEILRSEIDSRGNTDHTAMALVRRLRPAWLLARGQKSFTDESAMFPVVYIDEIRHGWMDTLHQIPSSEVMSMQFFSPADATTRWGTGHPSGVINVVTGR